jgi:Zn-finger nucleic acid-binding protein
MQCPTDGTTLVMSERGGIEIDYCPQCRGVWLDRGELDKIIERSFSQPAPQQQQYKRKKRESWLSELFD